MNASDLVATLSPDQRQACADRFRAEGHPFPRDCDTPALQASALALIETVIGFNDPSALDRQRQRVIAKFDGFSPDVVTAVVAYSGVDLKPSSDMNIDELGAIERTLTAIAARDLVLLFTDDNNPFLVTHAQNEARRHAADVLHDATGTHPDDRTHGRWRAITLIIGPTGQMRNHHLAGKAAAELAGWHDGRKPHTTTHNTEDTK